MDKPNSVAKAFSFVFLALLLGSVFARFWLGDRAADFTGPTHIAAGERYVYVAVAGDLFRLTPAGKLTGTYHRRQSGLTGDPIDLRVLADGRLLIAEQRPARIRICDVDSWQCRPAGTALGAIARQFKVLPGATPQELLATDARGDTLWRLSESGQAPHKLVADGTLAGPNDLARNDRGRLWIADTDHRRIIEFIDSQGILRQGRQHATVNDLTVDGRFYPMMLAQTNDGRLWVTQAAELSEPYADLTVYDPDDGIKARVDLPAGAYATDVASLGDSVLVTDMERFRVYEVRLDSLEVSRFGDEAFYRRLREVRERRAYFDRLGSLSLIAVFVFAALMITAAVMATPRGHRFSQPAAPFDLANAPEATPKTSGIHWLERNPAVERSLMWLQHLGFILFILVAAGAVAMYVWIRVEVGDSPDEELTSRITELGALGVLTVLVTALLVPIVRISTRAMKHRLGTDGRRLYIRLADGRELTVEPSRLVFTDRMILYRQYVLPLVAGRHRPMYAKGEVETWLGPLLRHAQKLTAMEAMKRQFKKTSGLAAWALTAVILVGLVVLAILALQK